MNTAWTRLTSEPDQLGESPFWHAQEQRLYWVDIPGRRVARAVVEDLRVVGPVEHWQLDEEPGCIAPAEDGALVLALRSGIHLARQWGGALHKLAEAPYDRAHLRFNDGKCDAQGRFWAGSLYEPKDQALAALYRLDGSNLHRMATGVTTANGLAWSPDGRTLYWADTAAHRVRAFDCEPATGALTCERLFHQMPSKPVGWSWDSDAPYGGRPDGATVDTEGGYWSAQYEGQRLLRLSPAGDVMAVMPTPVPCPTMPCLGGADFKTLFITTSRQGRSAAELARFPHAGCVFAVRVDVPGQPTNVWRP